MTSGHRVRRLKDGERRMSRRAITSEPAPHSWDIEHWPQSVYPHTSGRARYLVRAHRDALLTAGALSRVGREIIIIGSRYSRWLELGAANVPGYEIAANRSSATVQDAAA